MCISSVHLDRSSKSLLKGKPGTIMDWELSEDIEGSTTDVDLKFVPKCVYIQFYKNDDLDAKVPCAWKIGDLPQGVYPVTPVSRIWDFNNNKVSRYQLPLIPAFARTAYSMQGRTLCKGKIDLTMSSPMDPTTGYVAMSRFKKADDVLIMQPFDLAFYQQGPMLEPTLFLEANKRRFGEGLEIHSLFDGYETKKVRAKKRKTAEKSKEGKEKSAKIQKKYQNTEHGKTKRDEWATSPEGKESMSTRNAKRNSAKKMNEHTNSPEGKESQSIRDANKNPAKKMKCSRNLYGKNKPEVSAKADYRNPSRNAFCNVCLVKFILDPKRGKDKSRKCPDCRAK